MRWLYRPTNSRPASSWRRPQTQAANGPSNKPGRPARRPMIQPHQSTAMCVGKVLTGYLRESGHLTGRSRARTLFLPTTVPMEPAPRTEAPVLVTLSAALRPPRGYLETWMQDRVRPDSVQVPGGMLPYCGCPPLSLAWLSHGLLAAGHRARGGSKGVCPARSSSALLADSLLDRRGGNRWA